MESPILCTVVAAYLLAAFAWPTLRLWRATGTWPVVFHRRAAPVQRALGALSGALLGGMAVLAVLHLWPGPRALGVSDVPRAARAAAWLLMAAGAALTVVAQRQMGASWRVGIDDRPTALVTGGVFAWVRNPVFSGLLLFLAGLAILSLSWWSIAGWALAVVGIRVQVGLEERHLLVQHGSAFRDYAARVGRFAPGLGRLQGPRRG